MHPFKIENSKPAANLTLCGSVNYYDGPFPRNDLMGHGICGNFSDHLPILQQQLLRHAKKMPTLRVPCYIKILIRK